MTCTILKLCNQCKENTHVRYLEKVLPIIAKRYYEEMGKGRHPYTGLVARRSGNLHTRLKATESSD